jgi:hypothetical protein
MEDTEVMRIFCAACLIGVAGLLGAAPAAADPEDLLPYCSGDQTPMDNNCRPMSHQVFTGGDAPGANPGVPIGVNPGVEPAI